MKTKQINYTLAFYNKGNIVNVEHVAEVAKLKDLPMGEPFKRLTKGKPNKKVYIRQDYDCSDKTFDCGAADISNSIYLKGDTVVCVNFDY